MYSHPQSSPQVHPHPWATTTPITTNPAPKTEAKSSSQKKPGGVRGGGSTPPDLGNIRITPQKGDSERNLNKHKQWVRGYSKLFCIVDTYASEEGSKLREIFTKEEMDRVLKRARHQKACGTSLTKNVYVGVSESGKGPNGKKQIRHKTLGTKSCDHPQTCPHCAKTTGDSRVHDSVEAFKRWQALAEQENEHGVMALTLTVPHNETSDPRDVMNLLFWALDDFNKNNGMGRSFFNRYGVEGFLRAQESTYRRFEESKHGISVHPHFHMALFCKLGIFDEYKLVTKEDGSVDFVQDVVVQDELIEKELEISREFYAHWEESLRKVIKKERVKNPNFCKHIDLKKKNICKAPFKQEAAGNNRTPGMRKWWVKGGVSVEVARNGSKYMEYMAKELAYSGKKQGKALGTHSGLGLLDDDSYKATWTDLAFAWHTVLQFNRRSWAWSQKVWKDEEGKRKQASFNEWLREVSEIEEDLEEEARPVIVAMADGNDFDEKYDSELVPGALDKADGKSLKEGIDWKKETEALFQPIGIDEVTQNEIWERFEAEKAESIKRMQEALKATREAKKRNKYSSEWIKRNKERLWKNSPLVSKAGGPGEPTEVGVNSVSSLVVRHQSTQDIANGDESSDIEGFDIDELGESHVETCEVVNKSVEVKAEEKSLESTFGEEVNPNSRGAIARRTARIAREMREREALEKMGVPPQDSPDKLEKVMVINQDSENKEENRETSAGVRESGDDEYIIIPPAEVVSETSKGVSVSPVVSTEIEEVPSGFAADVVISDDEDDFIIIPPMENDEGRPSFFEQSQKELPKGFVVGGAHFECTVAMMREFRPVLKYFQEVQRSFGIGRVMNTYDLQALSIAISKGLTPWALEGFIASKATHFMDTGMCFYGKLETLLRDAQRFGVFGDLTERERVIYLAHGHRYWPALKMIHENQGRYGSYEDMQMLIQWIEETKGHHKNLELYVNRANIQKIPNISILVTQRLKEEKARGIC